MYFKAISLFCYDSKTASKSTQTPLPFTLSKKPYTWYAYKYQYNKQCGILYEVVVCKLYVTSK